MLCCSAVLLPAMAWAQASNNAGDRVDSAWVLQRLARPAPMHTSFVEIRESALLKAPLRVSGEYARPRADTLVRQVRAPYLETTTIVTGKDGDGRATIVRPGQPPRSFPLSRAPQLAGLQASFGALLSGDRVQLERHYRVTSRGTRQRWTMQLDPRDASLAASVSRIELHGRGAELRCIETTAPQARPAAGKRVVAAAVQRTLLAGAARAAGAATSASALVALCHGDATS